MLPNIFYFWISIHYIHYTIQQAPENIKLYSCVFSRILSQDGFVYRYFLSSYILQNLYFLEIHANYFHFINHLNKFRKIKFKLKLNHHLFTSVMEIVDCDELEWIKKTTTLRWNLIEFIEHFNHCWQIQAHRSKRKVQSIQQSRPINEEDLFIYLFMVLNCDL